MDGGKRIAALDANSMAPAAFTADIFKPNDDGQVPDRKNQHGWLAAGVPGVMAGLKRALDQYGTMRFSDVLQPAIGLTRDGFPVTPALAGVFGLPIGLLTMLDPQGRHPADRLARTAVVVWTDEPEDEP